MNLLWHNQVNKSILNADNYHGGGYFTSNGFINL